MILIILSGRYSYYGDERSVPLMTECCLGPRGSVMQYMDSLGSAVPETTPGCQEDLGLSFLQQEKAKVNTQREELGGGWQEAGTDFRIPLPVASHRMHLIA